MAIYKLGEITKMKSGSTPSRNNKDFWTNGNLKWLSSGEIKANVSFSKEKINSKKFKKEPFLKNSILMAMYGATAGKVGYLGENMYVNQAICVFNCYKNICFNKFLYYFLIKNSYKIKKRAVGGAQQNLSINIISDFEINLPSLKAQKEIIKIIEPYENLFLSYSQCVRIDNIKNTKKDIKNLIDIIEPIEKIIFKINLGNNLIKMIEEFLIQNLLKKSTNRKINELVFEKNQILNSKLIKNVSVGYNGFKNKIGKISKKSKALNQWEFVIGLISKNIPKGFNIQKKILGVSTAYKTFCSVDKIILKSWFVYKMLKNQWKKYLKPTSRQGQSFNCHIFLNDEIKAPSNKSFLKNESLIKNILKIKNNLINLNKRLIKLKEKIIYSLIR